MACYLPFFILLLALNSSAAVTVRYEPASPEIGPFPSDVLTVADAAQKTGRRVQMALPNCSLEPSSCDELREVNLLDGFALQPRLRVRFTGAINPDTLRDGMYLVTLDNLTVI